MTFFHSVYFKKKDKLHTKLRINTPEYNYLVIYRIKKLWLK